MALPAGSATCVPPAGWAETRADLIPSPDPKTTHGFFSSAEEAGVLEMFLEGSVQGQEVLMFVPFYSQGRWTRREVRSQCLILLPAWSPFLNWLL